MAADPALSARAIERTERPEVPSRPVDTLGFVMFCTYLVSGFANEFALRLFGSVARVSTVALLLLPLIWLFSRNRFRGLRHPIGRWWVPFLILLIIDAPFSVWRGGTITLLINYVPRQYAMFFYITAFAVTVRRCRKLMFVYIFNSTILLFSCFMFGVYADDGRLRIPDSLFFSNSNELALGLLTGITQFAFLFYGKSFVPKVFATICIAVSTMYMLRTGSRGCMLAAIAYALLIFFFSRRKVVVLVAALAVAAIGVATLPSITLRRLSLLGFDDSIQSGIDEGAIGSRLQRTELIKRSIHETFMHPLVGVGPGQFAVEVAGDAAKKGEWSAWVGTHNSYTQVSSECGIPAFICYCAMIVLCFRLSYRVFRAAGDNPEYRDIAGLSFTLLSGPSYTVLARSSFIWLIPQACPLWRDSSSHFTSRRNLSLSRPANRN